MTPAEVLRKARSLVMKGWIRYNFAADAKGNGVAVDSARACKFCARGAIYRAGGEVFGVEERLVIRAARIRKYAGLGRWNDAKLRSKRDVLRAFDRAIALAEGGRR